MQYCVLGDSTDGPKLRLDYREFAYAGKFVMSNTGKSVAFEDPVRNEPTAEDIVGAVAFSPTHDDEETVRLRYVTVRESRRGEGIGSRLLRYTADWLENRYDTVAIAVNNPVAYRACYRAGFNYSGTETGIAELLMHYGPSGNRDRDRYLDGLAVFRERDLPPAQRAVLDCTDVPTLVESPTNSHSH